MIDKLYCSTVHVTTRQNPQPCGWEQIVTSDTCYFLSLHSIVTNRCRQLDICSDHQWTSGQACWGLVLSWMEEWHASKGSGLSIKLFFLQVLCTSSSKTLHPSVRAKTLHPSGTVIGCSVNELVYIPVCLLNFGHSTVHSW